MNHSSSAPGSSAGTAAKTSTSAATADATGLTDCALQAENERYAGTAGVSGNNGHLDFLPAFRDSRSGRVELARFADGRPAPIHLLCALPREWATQWDTQGQVSAIQNHIVAGFVRNGEFYTRDQVIDISGASLGSPTRTNVRPATSQAPDPGDH